MLHNVWATRRVPISAVDLKERGSVCRQDRAVDLISDVLPLRRLWYGEPNAISNAIGYAKFFSRSHDAVIRVYDAAGNVVETREHKGDFKEW